MARIRIILLLLVFSLPATAQIDSLLNSFQDEFTQFKSSIQENLHNFKNKNDSIFAQFLVDSWETFDREYQEKEVLPKPIIQPIIGIRDSVANEDEEILPASTDSIHSSETDSSNSDNSVNKENLNLIKKKKAEVESLKEIPKKKNELHYRSTRSSNIFTNSFNFDFYGSKTSLQEPNFKENFNNISSETISNFFESQCNSQSIDEIANELSNIKLGLELNDWGYYILVEKMSKHISVDKLSQTLFAWIILLKSGYNVKVGYNNENIYLLLPANENIYSMTYFPIDGHKYYLPINKNEQQEIKKLIIHKANYPQSRNLSMFIESVPAFIEQGQNRTIDYNNDELQTVYNTHLKDFYSEYPFCPLSVYFSTPLSDDVLFPLDAFFKPLFKEKSDKEKVEILLNFVQNAFQYKTDPEQFNKEKYFFPDELFMYPYSDCEDRSILFVRLVKHFTNLECIGVDWPGHVNTAIHFPEGHIGTYLKYKNKKYYICDPTHINASIGDLANKYKSMSPKVVVIYDF